MSVWLCMYWYIGTVLLYRVIGFWSFFSVFLPAQTMFIDDGSRQFPLIWVSDVALLHKNCQSVSVQACAIGTTNSQHNHYRAHYTRKCGYASVLTGWLWQRIYTRERFFTVYQVTADVGHTWYNLFQGTMVNIRPYFCVSNYWSFVFWQLNMDEHVFVYKPNLERLNLEFISLCCLVREDNTVTDKRTDHGWMDGGRGSLCRLTDKQEDRAWLDGWE